MYRALSQRLFSSAFARDALTLGSGTTLAQMILYASSPLFTRLYTPADFGLLFLFLSIAAPLSIVATLRYELAIALPEDDREAVQVLLLAVLHALLIGSLVLAVSLLFGSQILAVFKLEKLTVWLKLIPLYMVLFALYQSLWYWHNRKSNYRTMALARIAEAGSVVLAQLAFWFFHAGPMGLVLGTLVGQLCALSLMTWGFVKNSQLQLGSFARLSQPRRKYAPLSRSLVASHLLGSLHQQLPSMVLGRFFGLSALGHFALAHRITSAPTLLIASAIGDVFRQRAARQYQLARTFDGLFVRTLGLCVGLGLLPTLVFMIWGVQLFTLLFGPQWKEAGQYASLLAISAFFSFISTPVDKAALIVQAKQYIFLWHLFKLLTMLGLYGLMHYLGLGLLSFLQWLVVIHVVFYLIDLYFEYRFSTRTNPVPPQSTAGIEARTG